MKAAMHPDHDVAGELHRLTDNELQQHMHALSVAVASNRSDAEQLALRLAQQLHGLAVEHEFLKICRLLNAYDFTAAKFMLQHLQDRLRT